MNLYDWIVDRYERALAEDSSLPAKLSDWLETHSSATPTGRTYDTDEGRLAYCLAHFALGVSAISRIFGNLATRRPFPHPYTFFRKELTIVSLGSGPGADLVGCLASLGAVPRKLQLYAADKEDGWRGWVESAVKATIASDPLLTAVSPTLNFEQLDLNDKGAVEEYIKRFRLAGPTVFVMHRVLGSVARPAELSSTLASELLPDEAMVIVIAPPRDGGHLTHLSSLLDKCRQGWVTRHEAGMLIHHGWTIPGYIWNALTHKPETKAEYDVIMAMRDVVGTLRWPEIGHD